MVKLAPDLVHSVVVSVFLCLSLYRIHPFKLHGYMQKHIHHSCFLYMLKTYRSIIVVVIVLRVLFNINRHFHIRLPETSICKNIQDLRSMFARLHM